MANYVAFQPHTYVYANVEALQLNANTSPSIIRELFRLAIKGKLTAFSVNVVAGEVVPTISFKLKDDTVAKTLSNGEYYIRLNDTDNGSTILTQADNVFSSYYTKDSAPEIVDPNVPREEVTLTSTSADFSDATKDIKLVGTETVSPESKKLAIIGKSAYVDSVPFANLHLDVTTTEATAFANLNISGALAKSLSNAGISVNANKVVVEGGEYAQSGYNGFEIASTAGVAPTEVTISDVDFTGTLSNNAIIVFNAAPNTVITVKNCHFASVSNILRFSNRDNVNGVVINIEDCTIDKWDKRIWAGAICLQDYTSTTMEEFESANRFGKDKLTINFIRCYGPSGLLTGGDKAIGSKDPVEQVVYVTPDVYTAGGNFLPYEGNMDKYPTVNFL